MASGTPGLKVERADLDLYDAYTADEAFITSTSLCLCPMGKFNGTPVADGTVPGPVTTRLMEAYKAEVKTDYVAQYLSHLE